MTDAEIALVRQLKAGDDEAWREVFETLMPQLLGYATRMLGNRQNAEEVVQEALVSVYRAIDNFEGRASIKSWMFKAVHHRAIDELRRRRRYTLANEEEVDHHAFGPDGRWVQPPGSWEDAMGARLDAREMTKVVGREIENLSHDHREALLLKEVHGLSTQEICDTLGITPANFRVRLHRARRALRKAVDLAFVEV